MVHDESSGTLLLFNPSSTTYVKHFISNVNKYHRQIRLLVNNYLLQDMETQLLP
jgi:hypothetical protein